MLTAEDEIFKTSAYRSEAARLAAKAGIDLGLEGKALTKHIADTLRKIPDEMHRKALQAAKVATFQDDTMGGGWLGKMSHHARMMTKDVPALKFVVPFITTPANVVRAGIEASALPWLNPKMVYDATQPGAAGNVKAAKLAGGAIMTVLAYSLYHAGIITGDGPDDMEQRKVLEADEWQKNSIRVGDTYLSYDRLDPVATPFVVTATFFDRSRFQRREHELIADTGAALWAAGTHFFELPFLQGMQNLSKLPDQGWKGIGKLVGKTASGFIPFSSLIATIARVDDPEATGVTGIKAGFGGDGVALDTIDEAMAQLQSRTPFWRDGLRPARNWDSSIQMAPLGGLLVPFNPMPARAAKNDNATGALIRYGVTSPEPTPMLNIGRGISVNLLDFDGGRGAVYDAFLVGVGKARREAVIDAMENSAAFTLTEAEDMHGERALALQTAIQKGKERGTSEFLRETLPALVAKGEINLAPIAKLLEDEGKAGVIDAIREEGRKSTRAEGRFEDTRKPKRIINPSGTGVRLQ
jgi:hypothetical protein